jgi:hypothetical protein
VAPRKGAAGLRCSSHLRLPEIARSATVLHQPLIEPDDVKWRLAGQGAATVLNCATQGNVVCVAALSRVVRRGDDGRSRNGLSMRNSPWRTGSIHQASMQAVKRGCLAKWSYNGLSCTISPRARLTRIASSFMRPSSVAPIRPGLFLSFIADVAQRHLTALARRDEEIKRILGSCFKLDILLETLITVKRTAAKQYQSTYESILHHVLTGDLLHIDETHVSVGGRPAYVWVFANLYDVAFFYTESREGAFLHDMLKNSHY